MAVWRNRLAQDSYTIKVGDSNSSTATKIIIIYNFNFILMVLDD